MADRKLTDLSSHTSSALATGDLLHIVDISEAAAVDKNKSITVGEVDKRYQGTGFATDTTTYAMPDSESIFAGDTSSGAFTVTLPTAVGKTGKVVRVIKTNAQRNKLTVDGNGAETIAGSASYFMLGHDECMTLVSDGSNWQILAWDEGRDIVTTNTFTENNNIDDNQLVITFKRECMVIKDMTTTWSGSAGSAVSVQWVLPDSLTIDTTRRNATAGSITNHEATFYGWAMVFQTGWIPHTMKYASTTSLNFAWSGTGLLYSALTASDGMHFHSNVEIPIA